MLKIEGQERVMRVLSPSGGLMTHLFKKFTLLFLAGLLCTSAPAHSTESWGSLALKGLGTWAACVGIGLGSTIAHEYAHAVTAETLIPGSVGLISFGDVSFDQLATAAPINRPLINPLFFPNGIAISDLFGLTNAVVLQKRIYGTEAGITAIAGPLLGISFLTAVILSKKSPLQQRIFRYAMKYHIGSALFQLIAIPGFDGENILQNLCPDSRALYNAIALPTLCYVGYKLFKLCDQQAVDTKQEESAV